MKLFKLRYKAVGGSWRTLKYLTSQKIASEAAALDKDLSNNFLIWVTAGYPTGMLNWDNGLIIAEIKEM